MNGLGIMQKAMILLALLVADATVVFLRWSARTVSLSESLDASHGDVSVRDSLPGWLVPPTLSPLRDSNESSASHLRQVTSVPYSSSLPTASPTRSSTHSPTKPPMVPTPSPLCGWSRRNEMPGTQAGPLVNILHVPKAGGTSVRELIKLWMRVNPGITFKDSNVQKRCEKGDALESRHGIYIGHTGWGIGDDAPQNRVNIVIMREPVARFVSWFAYMRQLKRAPHEWNFIPLAELLRMYRDERLTKPWALDTGQVSKSSLFIHHALLDQLSLLATYKCVSPTPDVNPGNCARPNYVFDSNNDTALCSTGNMKRLALENLRAADGIVLTSQLDAFVTITRFHVSSISPQFSYMRRINAGRRAYDPLMRLTSVEHGWLREWLKPEIEVYEAAEKIAAEQHSRASSCMARNTFT